MRNQSNVAFEQESVSTESPETKEFYNISLESPEIKVCIEKDHTDLDSYFKNLITSKSTKKYVNNY